MKRRRVLAESSTPLPTEADINVFDSLDERSAVRNFLGKTIDEAEAMFRENAFYPCEDLMWMGPKAFCFYVTSAIRYLESDASAGDSDAVNCFVGTVEHRLSFSDAIEPSFPALREAMRFLLDHWDRYFHPDTIAIYGDLPERAEAVLSALSPGGSRERPVG
jgi:hypothetical protein